MEFWCHYCRDWIATEYCKAHFESVHGQDDVTFENLKKRLAGLGGVETRDEAETKTQEEENEKVFVTNNFTHRF